MNAFMSPNPTSAYIDMGKLGQVIRGNEANGRFLAQTPPWSVEVGGLCSQLGQTSPRREIHPVPIAGPPYPT